jgi:hypothetical protein
MRKVSALVMLVAMLAAVSNSEAYIRVVWGQTAPTMEFGQVSYAGVNGVNAGCLVQLIWSLDGIIDPVALNGSATGNDQVLATDVFVDGGPGFEGFLLGHTGDQYVYTDLVGLTGNAQFVSGRLYMRAFDQPSGSIGYGTHYLQSALVGGPLADSPTNVNDYNVVDYTGGVPVALNMTIVPEPGTLALFGIGLVTLAARRRMRK